MLKKTKFINKFGRMFSFLSPTATLVVGITLAVAALVVLRPMFSETLEFKLYDLKMRIRGPRPPGPEIVIVAIDDISLRRVGRWPWSREVMGKLLTRLKEGAPASFPWTSFSRNVRKPPYSALLRTCAEKFPWRAGPLPRFSSSWKPESVSLMPISDWPR
jgi:hypothetical protein